MGSEKAPGMSFGLLWSPLACNELPADQSGILDPVSRNRQVRQCGTTPGHPISRKAPRFPDTKLLRIRSYVRPGKAGVVPSAFVLAVLLGLTPMGLEQDLPADAGRIAVDVEDDVRLEAGPAGVQVSKEGVVVATP